MAITDPDDLPGIRAWYTWQDTGSITTSGSNVTRWDDQSANGNDIGMTNTSFSPQVGGTLQGANVVTFDGDFMTMEPGHGAGYLSPAYTGTELTWFALIRRDGTSQAYGRVANFINSGADNPHGSDSFLGILRDGGDGSWPWVLRNGELLDAGSDTGSGAAWKRIIITLDGTTAKLYVDGSELDSASDTRSFNFRDYVPGHLSEGGHFSLAVHGWCDQGLNSTEVGDLDDWLNDQLTGGGGTDGTATPAAIAVAVTLPAPTKSAGSRVTPAAISTAATLPTPTASGSKTVAPAAIATAVTLPAASKSAGSTVTPAATAVTVAIPAATASGSTGGTAQPAAITVPVTIPAPTLAAGGSRSPAAIAMTVTLPAVSASGTDSGTATPAAITTSVTLPAPTATGTVSGTATPSAIAATVTIPQVTASGSRTVAASAITATVTIPSATASGGSAGTASPAAISVPVTLPAPTLQYGSTANPAALNVAITIGAVIASGLVPDANPITFTVRDTGHTLTVQVTGNTVTIRDRGHTATAREQR